MKHLLSIALNNNKNKTPFDMMSCRLLLDCAVLVEMELYRSYGLVMKAVDEFEVDTTGPFSFVISTIVLLIDNLFIC